MTIFKEEWQKIKIAGEYSNAANSNPLQALLVIFQVLGVNNCPDLG